MIVVHPTHEMKYGNTPDYCLKCGQFDACCKGECKPVPESKRFWCGGVEELIDGLTDGKGVERQE